MRGERLRSFSPLWCSLWLMFELIVGGRKRVEMRDRGEWNGQREGFETGWLDHKSCYYTQYTLDTGEVYSQMKEDGWR